ADYLLRSQRAPIVDRITVSPLAAVPGGESVVSAEAEVVCRGRSAHLEVTLTNPTDERVRAALSTPYGARPVVMVQPGETAERSLPTRGTEAEPGEVTVPTDGSSTAYPYPATSCD